MPVDRIIASTQRFKSRPVVEALRYCTSWDVCGSDCSGDEIPEILAHSRNYTNYIQNLMSRKLENIYISSSVLQVETANELLPIIPSQRGTT
jgi:hypothetical protein